MDFEKIFYVVIALVYFLFTGARKAKKSREKNQSPAPPTQKRKPQRENERAPDSFGDILKELFGDQTSAPEPTPSQKPVYTPQQATHTIEIDEPEPFFEVDLPEYRKHSPKSKVPVKSHEDKMIDALKLEELLKPKRKTARNNEAGISLKERSNKVDFNLREAIIFEAIVKRPYR